MKQSIAILIAALAATGCATQVDDVDPHCMLMVDRTVTHNGQFVSKKECVAWTFGPTRREQDDWDKRHPVPAKP